MDHFPHTLLHAWIKPTHPDQIQGAPILRNFSHHTVLICIPLLLTFLKICALKAHVLESSIEFGRKKYFFEKLEFFRGVLGSFLPETFIPCNFHTFFVISLIPASMFCTTPFQI